MKNITKHFFRLQHYKPKGDYNIEKKDNKILFYWDLENFSELFNYEYINNKPGYAYKNHYIITLKD